MARMVLGVFSLRDEAEMAIRELERAGFDPKDVSIIMKNREEAREISDNTEANIAGGAVTGATAGGAIGALAGLLIGVGAIAVPGVGALLIGGPIAAALGLTGAAAATASGALTGALAGGLIGGLLSLGVPETDARIYEDRIKEGGILLLVPVTDGNTDEAREILETNGADQIKIVGDLKSRRGEYESQGSPAFYSDVPRKRSEIDEFNEDDI